MLVQKITERYNKTVEKAMNAVPAAMLFAAMAFIAWQAWVQLFIPQPQSQTQNRKK